MFHFRLHTKFLVLILGSLVVILGVLSSVIVQREARLLTQKSIEKQQALAYAIVANLQDNMMKGRPRSTLDLIKHIQGTLGLKRLEVLRRDGAPAFGDVQNRFTAPQLGQAFATGVETDFPESGDPPVHTIIIPLKNESLCHRCHTDNGPIIGAVVVSLSMEDTIRELVHSKRDLTTLLSVIILLIGGLLYFAIRKVVLQPLAELHQGAERIGRKDLTHRIVLSTQDELQDLAKAFNDMAGNLEESYAGLEEKIRNRTSALHSAVDDALDKADRLFVYSRNMATISRLSTKVFSVELSQDDLLDRFLQGVTRGLGYRQAMLCIVDRKRVWLDIRRDTGVASSLQLSSQSLLSDDPFVKMVRTGKVAVVPNPPVNGALIEHQPHEPGPPTAFYVVPLLNRSHTKACWQITSCIKTNCPARKNQDIACWLLENTLCGNPLVESYGNKLAYCVNCQVFPIIGALIVEAEPHRRSLRGKNVNVLRILAAEMAAALENQRLHEDNQRMVKELLELHRVTAGALSELSPQKAMEVFTDSALKFSGVDACAFWLVNRDNSALERKAGGCIDGEEIQDLCPDRVPQDQGLIGHAFQQNSFVIDYNVARNDSTPLSQVATEHGLNSLLAISLKSERGPIGVFTVHKRSLLPFLEAELAGFMLLANQAAMAINVCLLGEELHGQNRELARRTNLLSGILSSMASGVLLLTPDNTVSLVNLEGASILRSRREDLLDRRLTDLFPKQRPLRNRRSVRTRKSTSDCPTGPRCRLVFQPPITATLRENRKASLSSSVTFPRSGNSRRNCSARNASPPWAKSWRVWRTKSGTRFSASVPSAKSSKKNSRIRPTWNWCGRSCRKPGG